MPEPRRLPRSGHRRHPRGLLLVSIGACSGAPAGGVSFLRDVAPPASASARRDAAVKRSRYVAIDLTALRKPSTHLDLFPGSSPGGVTVVWDRIERPAAVSHAWSGDARGAAEDTVTLVVNQAERVVAGTIRVSGPLCRIRY